MSKNDKKKKEKTKPQSKLDSAKGRYRENRPDFLKKARRIARSNGIVALDDWKSGKLFLPGFERGPTGRLRRRKVIKKHREVRTEGIKTCAKLSSVIREEKERAEKRLQRKNTRMNSPVVRKRLAKRRVNFLTQQVELLSERIIERKKTDKAVSSIPEDHPVPPILKDRFENTPTVKELEKDRKDMRRKMDKASRAIGSVT